MYKYERDDFKNKMITPGELNVNNQKYVFVMNTKKKCRLGAQKAAELNGYRIIRSY
jgi:hypothetical protein